MGEFVHNDILDGSLNIIKNNATQIVVCSGLPTNYNEAIASLMLAIKSTLISTDFTGPMDDVLGRKLTIDQQTIPEVSVTGIATHVCLCDATSRLLYVTDCISLLITDGNTVTIPAWDIIITD